MPVIHNDLTDLIKNDLIDIFEHEPLGLNDSVEYAISFPVLPGQQGPQICLLLILSIPSVLVNEKLSSGRTFPGLRPSREQLTVLVRGVLEDLHAQKDQILQSTMAASNGERTPLDGVPRFDLSQGLPPI